MFKFKFRYNALPDYLKELNNGEATEKMLPTGFAHNIETLVRSGLGIEISELTYKM